MTFLILGEPEDDTVVEVASSLAARGHPVSVVMSCDLQCGSSLSCEIGDDIATSVLRLSDGVQIDGRDVDLVLNRLQLDRAPPGSTAHQRYVGEEWHAAVAGWLRTMACPVLNPPRGMSVTGLCMSQAEWRVAAARVGMPTAPCPDELAVDTTMLVIGDDVIGGAGLEAVDGVQAVGNGLLDLSTAVGLPLIEAWFSLTEGIHFVGANVWPDLTRYGDAAVEAIERSAGHHGSR